MKEMLGDISREDEMVKYMLYLSYDFAFSSAQATLVKIIPNLLLYLTFVCRY